MKILYITQDYLDSKVHYNLCEQICAHREDVEELTVYCVARSKGVDIDQTYGERNFNLCLYRFDGNLKRFKYDFAYKTKKKYGYLMQHENCSRFDVTYAATLFTEGVISYKLYKEYGIPYVVAVRGTDANLYLKYAPHLWPLAYKILNHASKVVFISGILQNAFLGHWLLGRILNKQKEKCIVLPNGIDEIWHENLAMKKNMPLGHKLLYVGNFSDNKNVSAVQQAVLKLRKSCYPDITLTLVGGGGDKNDEVLATCKSNQDTFKFLGKIFDKQKLMEVMREHDAFVMVSHSETFGLVYVEALSQGLPIVYTKGQGIDGTIRKNVGVPVNSHSVDEIADGIHRLFEKYGEFDEIGEEVNNFRWNCIGDSYLGMLNDAASSK